MINYMDLFAQGNLNMFGNFEHHYTHHYINVNIVDRNDPINHDQDKGNTNLFYNALKSLLHI